MFAYMPTEALARNFTVGENAFANTPKEERFIFQASPPPPLQNDAVAAPNGAAPQDM